MCKSYAEIKRWRQQQMTTAAAGHGKLNLLHDEVMKKAVQLAVETVQREWGDPPAPFAFFLMGSAGRFEQSVWSDQDHGIVYDGDDHCQSYFLKLGSEISCALHEVGYEWCDGKVMASNPLWCKSFDGWKSQISSWLKEASWESIRHFLTFFDSRVLTGEKVYLNEIKEEAFSILKAQPHLYHRLVENVDFMKKGVGLFGQLLPELHGDHVGDIHLKQTVFFPYVNALRLLALKDEIKSPSTLTRFKELRSSYSFIKGFEGNFKHLLEFRLHFCKHAESYEEVHLLPVHVLKRKDKQELKHLIKMGRKLFSEVKSLMMREGYS